MIVPPKLRSAILSEVHSSHLGINKCKSIARSYCFRPLMDKDIENICRLCISCNTTNVPLSRIHLDFATVVGQKYFVVTDSFTKWLEIFNMSSTNAEAVINLLRSLFSRFGFPDTISYAHMFRRSIKSRLDFIKPSQRNVGNNKIQRNIDKIVLKMVMQFLQRF